MSKKLKNSMIIFFILLLAFIGFLIYMEYMNMNSLKIEYPNLPEAAYSLRKESLTIWGIKLFIKFFLPVYILISGIGKKIMNFADRYKSLFAKTFIYGAIFFTIIYLVNLPLDFYSSFYLRHKYGLSNQSIFRWLEVSLKNFIINDLCLAFALFIPFYLIKKNHKTWWLKMSLLIIPIVVLLVFITPVIIDPIFNDYESINNSLLAEDIMELANKAGIKDADVYLVNKSRDTKTMNAYMTGILNSKRIVLWDTTIENLEREEVLSIMAHEIGHYLEGHIWESITLSFVRVFIIMYLMNLMINWIIKESKGALGIRNISDISVIALAILILNIILFVQNPISNYVSRNMEVEADYYEISLTNNREAAVSAMEKLYDQSLGLPRASKIYEFWYNSHPNLEDRIDFYKNYIIK